MTYSGWLAFESVVCASLNVVFLFCACHVMLIQKPVFLLVATCCNVVHIFSVICLPVLQNIAAMLLPVIPFHTVVAPGRARWRLCFAPTYPPIPRKKRQISAVLSKFKFFIYLPPPPQMHFALDVPHKKVLVPSLHPCTALPYIDVSILTCDVYLCLIC